MSTLLDTKLDTRDVKVSNIRDLKVGDKITLVSKGIRRNDYNPTIWIDSEIKGSTSFFEITKVGQKYIYGSYYYYEQETQEFEKRDWEDKTLFSDYVITIGFNLSLKQRHDEYMTKVRAYDDFKATSERDIRWKVSKIESAMLENWRKQFPRPEPLEI